MYDGAASASASPSRERGWLRNLGVAMVCGMAGAAAVEGVVHFAGSAEVTVRTFAVWLAVGVVGMAVFHVSGAQLARDSAGSVKPRRFTSRFMVLGGLAYLGGVVVLVLIPLLLPAGPTLAVLPGWVLVLAGLLAFFTLVRHLGGDRAVDLRE